ncbi:MAG: type IV pili methyl-accepting chemotaxis transducer N-terminal domain-containing protein [Pseudomonadota bacterium]
MIGSHFAGVFTGGDADALAADINVSGRQRMLSQRTLYFASSYANSGFREDDKRQGLETAITEFWLSHQRFVAEAADARLVALYFGDAADQRLDALVRRFVEAASMVISGDLEAQISGLATLSDIGPGQVLTKLNAAVGIYEALAQENARSIAQISMLGYVLAVLVLVFEAVFIFRPAHRVIVSAFDQLEQTNNLLKERESQAFSALQESEDAWAEAEAANNTFAQEKARLQALLRQGATEIGTPLHAVTAALEHASFQKAPEDQQKTVARALKYAEIAQSICEAQVVAHGEAEIAWRTHVEADKPVCALGDIAKLAVEIASVAMPADVRVVLRLPEGRIPNVKMAPLNLLRLVLQLLRDAARLARAGDAIEVRMDIAGEKSLLGVTLTCTSPAHDAAQTIDIGVPGFVARDKQVGSDETAGQLMATLLESIGAEAGVSVQDGHKITQIAFQVQAHRVTARPRTGRPAQERRA